MPAIIRVVDGRTIIKMGENTALASKYATLAEQFANEAELSADAVEIAAAAVGVYTTVGAGESATTNGQSFYVASGGAVTLYINNAGTGDEVASLATASDVAARPTYTELASTAPGEGAALVGTSGGSNVQAELAEIGGDVANLGTITGIGGNTPSVIQFPGHNFLNSTAAASAVGAGTVDQPNILGGQGYIETFQGDGTTDEFIVSPGFVVEDAAERNVLVLLLNRRTRAISNFTEGISFTVSGKGTSSITISTTAPVAASDDLFVRVYRRTNSGAGILLNYISRGYDNYTDGNGFMTIMDGAHHVNINNIGGHNTFCGGASITIRDGSSYCFATGTSHDISASAWGFAGGGRGALNGFAATHFGISGKVGAYSFHCGQEGVADGLYSFHAGRKGRTQMAGEFVMGSGVTNDTAAGMMQFSNYPLRRTLTSSTWATFIALGGSNTFVIPASGTAHIHGKIHMMDVATGDFRFLELRTTVSRSSGTATTVVGQHAADADQITVLDESSAFAAGTWEARVIGAAGSGGFSLQVRGEDGRTIQSHGRIEVSVIDPLASVL